MCVESPALVQVWVKMMVEEVDWTPQSTVEITNSNYAESNHTVTRGNSIGKGLRKHHHLVQDFRGNEDQTTCRELGPCLQNQCTGGR